MLKSVGMRMTENELKALASAQPEAIEDFLLKLKEKLDYLVDNGSPTMARADSAMKESRGIASKSATRKSQAGGRQISEKAPREHSK